MPSEIPWLKKAQMSQQIRGREDEKRAAKKLGAQLHANSGAGERKEDFSTQEAVYEYKSVAKSHTLNGAKLSEQLRRAIQEGKDSKYVVYFQDANVTFEGTLKRGQ